MLLLSMADNVIPVEETQKTATSPKALSMPLLATFGVVVSILMFTVGYFYRDSTVTPNNLPLVTPTVTETPLITATTSITPTVSGQAGSTPTPATHPSYTLKIGKSGSVTVPAGWYVSKTASSYKDLTESELMDLTKNETYKQALIPIHNSDVVELTNGTSTYTISESSIYVWGPIGFEPQPLPASWTVVMKPTKDTVSGFARLKEGGKYKYSGIYLCSQEMCDGAYGQEASVLEIQFLYSGSDTGLTAADEYYKNNILGKTFTFNNL